MSAGTRARAARQEHEQRELIIELIAQVLAKQDSGLLERVLANQQEAAAAVAELQETTRKMHGTIRRLMEEYHEDLVDVHTRLEPLTKRPSLEPITSRCPSPPIEMPQPQTPTHPAESSGDESAPPRD